MPKFQNKVAIVTGSARGLGRDYARYFAADGAKVVLADIKGAEGAAADIVAAGGEAISVATDVTDPDSVAALVEQATSTFGGVDFLVNNAGLWRGLGQAGLLGCEKAMWDAAWAVNVTGTWLCYKAVVPAMRARGGGRIVNVSSIASASGASAYGLTKAAVDHMTKGMAREVGRDAITVNCVAPGISAFEGAKGGIAELDKLVESNAIARMGTSRDIYDAIAYLCGDAANWVTGQTLGVDGGALAR